MKRQFLLLALLTVAIAGFLTIIGASPSFANNSQAKENGVTYSLTGQYLGRGFFTQNQAQVFAPVLGTPTRNSFQVFDQRLRFNATVSYDTLASGMPLAMVATQIDLTNAYTNAAGGYGTNGWYNLGQTPTAFGFNHDFNTFGLRQAYIRVITPIGAMMFGRMPVKFGMGVAVNTNADGLGDFLPFGNIGVFAGVLFGNEETSNVYTGVSGQLGPYPPASYGYTHMQVGTIPTIEVMSLKPMNDVSWGVWLTEAHLNQFTDPYAYIAPGKFFVAPTANITFGGLSATYAANGTKLGLEADFFDGSMPQVSINPPASMRIHSYDIYLTGSQMLQTPVPMSIGLKFGAGSPISSNNMDMTYYSMLQNTRTLFGDVIGSNWQTIQFADPFVGYTMYGPPLGANLANKYAIMVDAKEFLPSNNMLQESLIYAAWRRTSTTLFGVPTQVLGGRNIGTEFDLNFTHHFTKTLAWQAWGAYVWTGSGVESYTGSGNGFQYAAHQNVTALGTDIMWNF